METLHDLALVCKQAELVEADDSVLPDDRILARDGRAQVLEEDLEDGVGHHHARDGFED